MNAPFLDGFLSHDLMVFGDDGKPEYVSCGFSVEAPVLENASLDFLNHYEAELRSLLRLLTVGSRMQVCWALESDCSQSLLHYYNKTYVSDLNAFAKRERSQRFSRYAKRMEAGDLRFQKVRIYFSSPFSGKGDFDLVLKAKSQNFHALENEVKGCIERLGGRVKRMTHSELFAEQFRYCNPSLAHLENIGELYDPGRSLMANILTGEGNAVASTDAGFFMDSNYFGFVIARSLPTSTYSGLIQYMTSLPIRDFGIVFNIVPLDATREIEKEEVEIERLRKSLQSGKQQRSVAVLEQRMVRVQRLAGNTEVPFQVQIIIRAWDATQEGLQTKLGILKSALTRMQLAKAYAPTFPTTARNYFRAGFPGWIFDSCQDFCHLIEDAPLANLLPVSGSPAFGNSEAIYDGANGNLIGINTFLGEEGSESPQHALVCGKSGCGKSCVVMDLLVQTAPDYDLTVIVDNGLSYQMYARTVDPANQPVIIKPDSQVTINYMSTGGSPLSAQHLVDAVAVTHLMAGRRGDQDYDRLRKAILSRCLNGFYSDFAQDWLNADPGRRLEVRRYAAVLHKMDVGGQALSLFDRHHRFHEWAGAHEAEAEELFGNVSEQELRGVSLETVVALSYVFLRPDEAPTHGDFQQWLELTSMGDGNDREEIGILATLLKAWCAEGGMYGAIFDGVGTVDFNRGKILHLELGQIPDSAPDLRAMTALVITNQIANLIQRLPRKVRKRAVFEELGSFLAIPGGEQLVSSFYQTMRKYNCWVVSVMQQMDMLNSCGSSIMGNMRLAILMKQTSPQEVEALKDAIQLPESAVEALENFPEPSRERGAPFLCWRSHAARPEILTGFHVASREMLYVSSSSGSHFEQRQEALARYDDVLTGIIAEAEKTGR